MPLRPWKTLRTRLLLDRSPRLRVLADDVQLPDGQVVEGYLRVETSDYAVIVPINDAGEVLFMRCYKRGVDAIDLQLPAGGIDPEESPLESAQRELREETGCQAVAWQNLGAYVVGGNLGINRVHIFLATGCRQTDEPTSGDLEEQELAWVSLQDARRWYRAGKVYGQVSTIAALGLAFAAMADGGQ
jgi:ADP-ribose pyrophosphatase